MTPDCFKDMMTTKKIAEGSKALPLPNEDDSEEQDFIELYFELSKRTPIIDHELVPIKNY